jgi:hypothetical protein
MPQSPDDPVDVTVRLHRDIYEKLEEWARSVFDEEPGDFLHLLTNTPDGRPGPARADR